MGSQDVCPCCGHGCPAGTARCPSCDAELGSAGSALEDSFADLAVPSEPGPLATPPPRRRPAVDRPRWKGPPRRPSLASHPAEAARSAAKSAAPLLGGGLVVCVALVAVAVWAARRMISTDTSAEAPVIVVRHTEQAPTPAPPSSPSSSAPVVPAAAAVSMPPAEPAAAHANADTGARAASAAPPAALDRRESAAPVRFHRAQTARPAAPPPVQPGQRDAAPPAVSIGVPTVDAPPPPPPPLPASPAAPAVAVARASAPSGPDVEDAPRYPTQGFRKPHLVDARCVQDSVRLPRGIAERLSGPVTVKFAVATDGTVGLFEVLSDVPDRRVADAVWAAVRGCRFEAGADATGRPTRLWVVMPIRFGG